MISCRSEYLFLISFFFLTDVAVGQEDSTVTSLDEVVFTALRKIEQKQLTPYSVQSLSCTTMNEYGLRTTPEALMQINGVFIQKTNHGGGSAFLRGLTGNQILLLVDGIRMNNSTFRYGPNQYLNTIDVFAVNRIEVAKGTGSVQYGSDALGGVLHIFTKEPEFATTKNNWNGKAIAKYMTGHMERTVRGEAGYASSNVAFHLGATYRNFGDIIGGDSTGKQSPSGYQEFATDAKMKFRLRNNVQLTFATQFLQQDHVPVFHKVALENFALNEFDPQRRVLAYGKLNIEGSRNILKSTELIASWQQSTERRKNRKNGNSVLLHETDIINTLGLTYDIHSEFNKRWTANSGVELYYDAVNSTRKDINTENGNVTNRRGLYPGDSKYGNYSVYSLHHFELGQWRLEAGARFNAFSIHINDSTLGKIDIFPSALVGNAAILYSVNQHHSIYATMSTGYRAPNVDDMGTLGIVDFRYEVPASDLLPEKAYNAEIGYKLKEKRFAASVSIFSTQLKNVITRVKMDGQVISGYPVYTKENIEEAVIRGADAELDWQFVKSWNIAGRVSYTYGQSITKNEPMRRIPPLNGRLMTLYRYQKMFGSVEWLFASRQDRLSQGDKDDNRIPKTGTPGWNVLNIYAGYQFTYFKLNTGIHNIFNKDYRTHGSGINGYGRSAWLQISFNF